MKSVTTVGTKNKSDLEMYSGWEHLQKREIRCLVWEDRGAGTGVRDPWLWACLSNDKWLSKSREHPHPIPFTHVLISSSRNFGLVSHSGVFLNSKLPSMDVRLVPTSPQLIAIIFFLSLINKMTACAAPWSPRKTVGETKYNSGNFSSKMNW